MGIYELVRRRCRYIICCDAEQDEDLRFDGIGNAIRKCRTDFGVDIDLPLTPLQKENGFSRAHCVVGRIKYPDHNQKDGYLLYLKASLTGDEATDVLNYRSEAPHFPHQTTADQWFDESQFESYRKLGFHIAHKALGTETLNGQPRDSFFEHLFQIWYPASLAVDRNSPAHTEMYGAILEAIRLDKSLESLDKDLFEGLQGHPSPRDPLPWRHDTGHVCNSLIQLMQRVFYDLHLEDRENREHPYVKGWIKIFTYWLKTESFRHAWAATGTSYPERFQAFRNELVNAPEEAHRAASA
jgi:hypothetical protein